MSAAAEERAATGLGWYVYGVVEVGSDLPATPGVGGDTALVPSGPVAALASRVDLGEFGEEPVRSRLEDPLWVEQKAREHEAVLATALVAGPVVPFRFLTVYADEQELTSFLTRHAHELQSLLRRLRGTLELGVKAFVEREALDRAVAVESPAVAELDAEIATAASGKAYLLRRRREQIARDESGRILDGVVAEAHARLRAASLDAVANAVQPSKVSGRDEQMILNGAYLVAAEGDHLQPELEALAATGAQLGITFELTGPWPPYNFVPRDLSEP